MSSWLRVRWRVDRVVAVGLVVAASPLWAAVWLAVRLRDGAPATVWLPRVGHRGVEFPMGKFRSMTMSSSDGSAGGPALTLGRDSRVTPLGRRLRHYRLDELPQLVNVVRGEMSLLGPRPETPVYVDLDDARWRRVLEAVPGIAGPTQVLVHDFEAGLGFEDLERYEAEMLPVKLAIDEWYLGHASPLVDFLVVWALLERFVARRHVSMLHRRVAADVPAARPLLTWSQNRVVAADGGFATTVR